MWRRDSHVETNVQRRAIAGYDLCQVVGWKHSLHAKPSEAKKFYGAIAGFTVLATVGPKSVFSKITRKILQIM